MCVYSATKTFPRDEIYGLRSQLRRAACSVGMNIVEGCGRDSQADFKRFLKISLGSLNELDYGILLARDLRLLDSPLHEELETRIAEIRRMATSLIRKLRTEN